MWSVNVEKMRKTLERSRGITEDRQRRARLAAMTPEHRRKHEGPTAYGICAECLTNQLQARIGHESIQTTIGVYGSSMLTERAAGRDQAPR